jgi:putative addiction module CopG family antidote
MTLVLGPELERLIQEKVQAGVYPTAEAMVRAAIARLLEDDEDFAPGELDALVQVGIQELGRGEGLDGAKVFEELRRKSASARAGQRS